MIGISTEKEIKAYSNSNSGSNTASNKGSQNTQSGHLVKLPFRIDVSEGEIDINIVEWRASANKTERWIQRGDLIKIGGGGHVVQTSRTKAHTHHTISLMHGYTHTSKTYTDVYLVVPGTGLSFEPDATETINSRKTSRRIAETAAAEKPRPIALIQAVSGEEDDKSYLIIGTALHSQVRPQMMFSDEHLQFLSRSMELSVLHGPMSISSSGKMQLVTRKDIVLSAGSGSKETETPRGSILLSANSVKGIRLSTDNEEAERVTGAISIRTGSTLSPQSSPGSIELVVGAAGVGSKGSSVTIRAGNVTGDAGVGGALRLHSGDAPGNFLAMENNNVVGGEAVLSSGSGLTASGQLLLSTGVSQFKSGDVRVESGTAGRGASGSVYIRTADAYTSGNIMMEIGGSKLKRPGRIVLNGRVMVRDMAVVESGGGEGGGGGGEGRRRSYDLQEKIQWLESTVERQGRQINGLLKLMERFEVGGELLKLEAMMAEMEVGG